MIAAPLGSAKITTCGRKIMKIGPGALGALLLAGIAWSAQAQGLPQGSYLQSCGNAAIQGDTLFAVCRSADGRDVRASLPSVSRCTGDIANNNGLLQCGGGQPYGQAQGLPQGSFSQSCGNVAIQDDTLFAVCRTADGRDVRASLPSVSRCTGDIANNNGLLQCAYGGGR
jgi:hypothetical protein